MDDIVKQALAKWPQVPHCYGWLGLDARGQWYMRDDRTQATGPFVQARGSLLQHEKLISFIHRNYECDALGQWFFQNGPQRVYVELELTPRVWRVASDGTVADHTGRAARPSACLVDEAGRVYLADGDGDRAGGVGVVHTLDVGCVADAIERGLWSPEPVQSAQLPSRFGFVISPQAAHQLLQKT